MYAARSGWNAASYVISYTPCATLLRRSAGFGRQFKNCSPSAAKGGAMAVTRNVTGKVTFPMKDCFSKLSSAGRQKDFFDALNKIYIVSIGSVLSIDRLWEKAV